MSQFKNVGRQWIQHGDNVITLTNTQVGITYIGNVTIQLANMGGVTTRGPYHNTNPMTPTIQVGNTTRLLVRLNGGFGFTTCGDNTGVGDVSGITERFDDITNTQTARTATTTAKYYPGAFSLNGLGFESSGTGAGPAPNDATERYDDITNAWTARTGSTGNVSPTGFSLNGYGFKTCGSVNVNERFDDVVNNWTARTAAITRQWLGGFGLNNYGFTTCGSTDGTVGGIIGTTERFDDIANNQTARTAATVRWLLTGFTLNGYGFSSCGQIAGPTNTGTTERLDDVANTQTGRLAATARSGPAGYSLNGFGFTSGGFIAAISAITERFDDVANTWTARLALNTARRYLAGYSTNEYFVNFVTMD